MEYPFKDLQPLDETTARTGYYRDWSHIDADTFHQISELVKFIREKGYGSDTREAIAQALERVYHDALISGNANMEVSMARKHFKDLASRLDASDSQLSSATAQLAQKVDKGNVSVSDINKNLGKLDQTFMSDEFLHQMAGNTPINAVPADGSLTTGKYADGSVIPDKTSFVRVGKNLFDKETITRDHNVNASGIVEYRVGYAVSDFIPIKPGTKYHTGSTHRFAFYDGSKAFVSSADVSPTLTAPSNARFLRINLANTASAINSFQVEIGEVATAYEPYKIEMRQMKLKQENYSLNSIFIEHLADKPQASILIQNGSVDYNTATKSLDFSEGSYFITHQGTFFNATSLLSGQSLPFGTEAHAMIYWDPATKNIEFKTAVSDEQAGLQRQLALMGFVAHAEPENALFNFEYTVDGLRPNKVKNSQWYKKKINLLGDSITFGGTWVGPLAKLTGATLTNYGVNGSAIQKRTSRTDSFNERYPAMSNDADLIVVWGGVNDHHWPQTNNSFGEPDSVDVNTFYGALNSLITGLIAKYPTKKIAFITPMKNWGYTGAPNWNIANSKGKTLTDHRDAIIERCNYYSIPVLDLFNESNIAPVTSQHKTAFMPDGLHPNDEGGKRIATMISEFINGL